MLTKLQRLKQNQPFLFKVLIIGVIAIILYIAFDIWTEMRISKLNSSPIVEIKATSNYTFKVSEKYDTKYFKIVAVRENGYETAITKNITFSQEYPNKIGEETNLTITWNKSETESFECNVAVKTVRDPIIAFVCGYPKLEDAKAVLYSNGELAFEGEGDILVFKEGYYPWIKHTEKDYPIKAVSFGEKISPKNMNYWFEGLKTLEYVDKIPSSVVTMVSTLKGCTSLYAMADWTDCNELLNVNSCYSGCTSLESTYPFPGGIRLAKRVFTGCSSLQYAADLTTGVSIIDTESMFEGDQKLITASMPPNVEVITKMYYGCINLREMPEIAETTKIMNSTFGNNLALEKYTVIPASVEQMNNTFSGCELMEGELIINANPSKYNAAFTGACVATKLNLTGSSEMLYALARTGTNITVNGQAVPENDDLEIEPPAEDEETSLIPGIDDDIIEKETEDISYEYVTEVYEVSSLEESEAR